LSVQWTSASGSPGWRNDVGRVGETLLEFALEARATADSRLDPDTTVWASTDTGFRDLAVARGVQLALPCSVPYPHAASESRDHRHVSECRWMIRRIDSTHDDDARLDQQQPGCAGGADLAIVPT